MVHPNKSSASSAHTAKLRKMTAHYGSASGPENNITSPQSRLKGEGPEDAVSFGADSSKASARSDKPARRSVAANPIATYARGGKVKTRAGGGTIPGMDAITQANKNQADAAGKSTGGVIARSAGGRTKSKGATTVNVIIAPQGGAEGVGAGGLGIHPQLAAAIAKPPMAGPPAAPPQGAPPMMPPQGGPPMPMRAKGGRVAKLDADEDTRDLVADTLREEGLIRRARGGGIHMTAGAATGIGRLEKMGIKVRHRGSMAPKEV